MIALAGCKFSLALNEFMVLTPDSTAFDPLSASAKQGLHMYIARWPRFYRVHVSHQEGNHSSVTFASFWVECPSIARRYSGVTDTANLYLLRGCHLRVCASCNATVNAAPAIVMTTKMSSNQIRLH